MFLRVIERALEVREMRGLYISGHPHARRVALPIQPTTIAVHPLAECKFQSMRELIWHDKYCYDAP